MMSHDPEGKMGPKMQLPDNVIVHEPKAEPPGLPFKGSIGVALRGSFKGSIMV